MTAFASLGIVDVAADLSLIQVPPLLSSLLRLLIVVALPHRLYCYLLSLLLLLLLLWLLPPVLTAKGRATTKLL
jgi:hypothetical protein